MNNSLKLTFALVLLCGSAGARVSDTAFIQAVKEGDLELVDRLYSCVTTRETFDKALRAAARNGDGVLFNMLAPKASPRGFRKGLASLKRHTRSARVVRNAALARQAFRA